MTSHSVSSSNSYIETQNFSPNHSITSVHKEHLKSYTHSILCYFLLFNIHMKFFCWFYVSKKDERDFSISIFFSLLGHNAHEEDAHFKNNSNLPWGHLATALEQTLKSLLFLIFNHFNLVRFLYLIWWLRSTESVVSQVQEFLKLPLQQYMFLMSHSEPFLVC